MRYEVRYTKDALKALSRMPRNQAQLIAAKIDQLADGGKALANNVKKLQGREGYRLRIGGYRVIYTVDKGKLIVTVIAVGARGGIYD
ncbi:MAG: type II toxin-antitoxin system RelE/ParE family toxin [Nevskia sp.]|nr:type II toxin-antitoxin system RelE/ParE family toxin [Nevskia sp.]